MRFLKKLSLRAGASRKASGQITVWMALSFLVFLSLYLVCLQSVQKQYQRKQAEQAVEAGMFSLFSEYEPHLLAQYDLFYLDTSFGGGQEREDELCSHLWQFTKNNLTDRSDRFLPGLTLQGVHVKNMVRATDGSGGAFYRQAIRVMKEKSGVSLAEDWMLQEMFSRDKEENIKRFQEDCEAYEGSVRNYEEKEDGEEDERMDPEAKKWDGVWKGFSLSVAVPDGCTVSGRTVDLETAPSHRELSVGAGVSQAAGSSLLERQWFISYLCEYLKQAQEMLKDPREQGYLDYQLEYLIAGKGSDPENLNAVLTRLLLFREGTNYVFLLSHPKLRQRAEALAVVLAGMTGNWGLVKSLEQLILLGWAYGESLVEVRQLLGGYELSPVKTEEDWQVSLSGLLPLLGDPGKYDVPVTAQKGIGYETCLRMLLVLQSPEELSMRALDIIEGELSRTQACRNLHLDHCVDFLTAQVWIDDLYLERNYGYE
ncbi:MAG: hypothetical protein K2P27_07445 [Lachnospiraceae bacterium]|nr:hypothetical protein [Lachnospiraceae bacterium]